MLPSLAETPHARRISWLSGHGQLLHPPVRELLGGWVTTPFVGEEGIRNSRSGGDGPTMMLVPGVRETSQSDVHQLPENRFIVLSTEGRSIRLEQW